jgi:hypothetical protein
MAGVLHGVTDASEPRVVTRAVADLDGDGRPDAIAVQMVSGLRYVDEKPWCGMSVGGMPKYEGRFVLRVTLAGQRPVDTDLNALFGESGDLWFHGDGWPIVLRDYNGDGRLEFSLGQYGSCNGWIYRILGVEGTGTVTALSGDIFSADRAASSAAFHPTPRGFRHTWYDNSRGSAFCAEFAWVQDARRFRRASEASGVCPEDILR